MNPIFHFRIANQVRIGCLVWFLCTFGVQLSARDLDYYSVLGLTHVATKDEITRSFRKLMMKVHPDRGGSADLAQDLNQIYRTLTTRRTDYDQGRISQSTLVRSENLKKLMEFLSPEVSRN